MLNCCNYRFRGGYFYVLANKKDFYRRIEFGICPQCGIYKFLDYKIICGKEKTRTLSGKFAEETFRKICKKLQNEKQGSKSDSNYYYGDFKIIKDKKTKKLTYLQLRKNFNNDTEILGEVETKIYKVGKDNYG